MASVPPASPLQPGYRLDRYELLCKIGQGGMASVWLSRTQGKHGFERFVAIKTVLPEHASDVDFRTMLLDEARIASAIDHPNVARILDVGEDQDIPYMVLEYVGGESLNRLRRTLTEAKTRVAPEIVLRILADTCSGLHAAHELAREGTNLGIVHRDVSPQNILINEQGITKLIDFGVAKATGRLAAETATGIIKGKVPYMAAEQALGINVDRRADVYSVGAIAYYLLAGVHAFDGPNDAARLIRAVTGERPAPLPGAVPAAVSDVVFRALSREAHARFATAAHLRDAIEDAMHRSSLSASTDDVARYVAQHLAEPSAARKRVIDHAIKAAEARAHAREADDFNPPSSPSLANARMSLTDSERTGGTIGAAVAERPIELAPRSRAWIVPVVLLAVVALLGGGYVVGSIGRSHEPVASARDPVASDPPSAASALEPALAPPPPLDLGEPVAVQGNAASTSAVSPAVPSAAGSAKVPARAHTGEPAKRPAVRPKKRDDDGIF